MGDLVSGWEGDAGLACSSGRRTSRSGIDIASTHFSGHPGCPLGIAPQNPCLFCRSGFSRELQLWLLPLRRQGEVGEGWSRFELIPKTPLPNPPLPSQGREQKARGLRRSHRIHYSRHHAPVGSGAARSYRSPIRGVVIATFFSAASAVMRSKGWCQRAWPGRRCRCGSAATTRRAGPGAPAGSVPAACAHPAIADRRRRFPSGSGRTGRTFRRWS